MSSPDPTVLNWALIGVAGILTLGRYGIRGYNSRRLYSDDFVHLLAFLVLVTHGVTNQLSLTSKSNLARVTATSATPRISQDDLFGMYQYNRMLNTVNNCFLYLVFWLVKIAFLLFYYQIFSISTAFKKAWWAVLIFTLLTFWIPIGGVLATCANAKSIADYKACNSATTARATKLEYSCAFNVATDLAIMALPLWRLKDLQIGKVQKISLAFIFSFAIVCVAFDILRTVEAVANNQALYTVLEINFVVIISCLPTYRALLNLNEKRKLTWPYKLSTGKSAGSSLPLGSKDGEGSGSTGDVEKGMERSSNGIYVMNRFTVTNKERDPYGLPPLDPWDEEFEQSHPAVVHKRDDSA